MRSDVEGDRDGVWSDGTRWSSRNVRHDFSNSFEQNCRSDDESILEEIEIKERVSKRSIQEGIIRVGEESEYQG